MRCCSASRTRAATLSGVSVERRGGGGGSAALGEGANVDDVLVGAEPDAELVAGLEQLGRLGAIAADEDLAGGNGIGGEGARLEEAGGPEPLVDPDASGPVRLAAACVGSRHAGSIGEVRLGRGCAGVGGG
jgi:hypothetical protein